MKTSKKRSVWKVIFTVLFTAVATLAVAAILYPVFATAKIGNGRNSNRIYAYQLAGALRMYASENDGRLPLGENWMDVIHVRPAVLHRYPKQGDARYGFAMNKWLSGLKISEVENPETVPLIYTSTDLSRNASGAEEILWQSEPGGDRSSATAIVCLSLSGTSPEDKAFTWQPNLRQQSD